ncbi:DUF6680 family protein [Legionella sp.]|uniref:DUF6680 family protein n=1 Tax=Legionella sp. TaxID=459 RepID=UPI003C8DB9E0
MCDVFNILAILLSPLIALQVQKILDNLSDKKRRKEDIFNTLMETRAQPLSFEHVRALNKIDVAFYKDKSITQSWNNYRDHLNSFPKDAGEIEQKIWTNEIPEKLVKMLFEMSKLLNYEFDEVLLKKGAYSPVAHGYLDSEQAIIRKGLVELFAFRKPLAVSLVNNPEKQHEEA